LMKGHRFKSKVAGEKKKINDESIKKLYEIIQMCAKHMAHKVKLMDDRISETGVKLSKSDFDEVDIPETNFM
jgi:hypothetical protein